MSEKINAWLFYSAVVLDLAILFALNYYHIAIQAKFSFIPEWLIPSVTVIFVIGIVLLFRKREKDIEDLEYEFLTIITHKFRTPLVSIKWVMDELSKDNVPHTEQKELIKDTQGVVRKLMEVVDNLAGIARSDDRLKYSFEEVSLRKMVDSSLEKLSRLIREKSINFDIQTDPQVPTVLADFQKIQFVMDALLENALKYTPEGGKIYVTLARKEKSIVFAVQDTGIGIKKDDKEKIFRKFYRSEGSRNIDPEGLGLALYMSKIIMKDHGGKLWAESEGENKGSIFFMQLPIPNNIDK